MRARRLSSPNEAGAQRFSRAASLSACRRDCRWGQDVPERAFERVARGLRNLLDVAAGSCGCPAA